ncbi:MAG: hypothetical protein V3U27_04290 [Candidatus Tectomicrobia bacterium]
MSLITIQVPDVFMTRALIDGSVKVNEFPVVFRAAVFDQRSSRRLRGEVEEEWAGTEQVLTDFLVRLSKGQEPNLVVLPIFVTRGMNHRKLVMRRGTLSPKDLAGKTVGTGRVLSAASVFLRGLLADDYGLDRSQARWVVGEPVESDGAIGSEWKYLSKRGGYKTPEMLSMLAAGDLDAVMYPGGAGGHWFNWIVEGGASKSPNPYGDLEQMVKSSPDLCFPVGDVETQINWFKRWEFYPLYHCLAVRREVAEQNPGLCAALVNAFDRAATVGVRYLTAEEQELFGREMKLLGVDPNRCGLTPLNVRSVEKCMDYLEADRVLPRRPTIKEIFPFS